eukprot:m.164777 g.164777  ORF g.164777 m.164777 type:complete len:443 (+) comp38886_c2_seq24:120-1448(+)
MALESLLALSESLEASSEEQCPGCGILLQEPYIQCYVCVKVNICLQCFAKGVEFDEHKNDHDYTVLTNAFHLGLDLLWTAREELALLSAIEGCGLGNWVDIARRVKTKSAEDCSQHYYGIYMKNPLLPLPKIPSNELSADFLADGRHYQFAAKKVSHDPPRPAMGTPQSAEMAGYMPWRGDFQIEYRDSAEQVLRDLSFSDDDCDLTREIKLSLVDRYELTLDERLFRKSIIRDFGLISWKNHLVYDMKSFASREVENALKPFMRLQLPEDHEKFVQGIVYEKMLKDKISFLQQYRREGLTAKSAIGLFEKLKSQRQGNRHGRKAMERAIASFDGKRNMSNGESAHSTETESAVFYKRKKPVSRLDVSALPGVEKLSEDEHEKCSSLRLQPLAYLQHKETLMQESKRLGRMKLADARRLIHIDVNKTSILFNFFLEKGWVSG